MKTSLRLISAAVLFSCSLLAQADIKLGDKLPVSPAVKVGKLPNGLTYYIQKNARPEKRLELRLVVKAGSILEDEDQRGLAHFTEHMAFNGSTNFKKNELISYLQSIGVRFGADLNAYTSFDETVYMLPIPTDKKENVETGFQVLEDWAHGVAFKDEAIESERGVVLEEERQGKGAMDRINKVLYPKLLNGSRYANRLPIGKVEVLRNFKPEAIRRFYRDWYRPDLMAVIAVGDIEPAEAEKLIQAHFGRLKNPAKPRARLYAKVPTYSKPEGVVITDPEAGGNAVMIRYPIFAKAEGQTYGDYRAKLIEGLYTGMLNQRIAELTQQANPPFLFGGAAMDQVVSGYHAFNTRAVLGKDGALPAITALLQEEQRARQFGFTAEELERGKKRILRGIERQYLEREKSESGAFVSEYTRNFLTQETMSGIEHEYNITNELVPKIALEEVNAAYRKAVPAQKNKLVVYTGASKAQAALPTSAELLVTAAAAEKQTLAAHEEKQLASQLMEAAPQGGSIVSESVNAKLGTTELVLGNGVKVVLKPSDFKNDQVQLGGARFGGQSLYGVADVQNARYASSIVGQMGIKNLSPLDLSKVLAGKTARVSLNIGELSEFVSGGSGSADIETMLQLVYLGMTQPRRDEALFQAFIGRQKEIAGNSQAVPEVSFMNAFVKTMFNDNPLAPGLPKPEDFDKVQLDRVLEIYRERFASARGFTFNLVGSFDVEKVKPLLVSYLGTLPAGEIVSEFKDRGVRPVRGVVKREVLKGKEQKSLVMLTFAGDAEYSPEAQLRLQALMEVLNIKVNEVLREQKGLIYSGGFHGALHKQPYGAYSITLNLPCGPENVDKVVAAALEEIRKVQESGPEAADLAKVKEGWSKGDLRAMRENGHWLSHLQAVQQDGRDPEAILTRVARGNAITAQDVQATAKRYLDLENYVQMVLKPEPKAGE
ncbi:pitrilysin family protein [Massilia sp. erpn]|uniref:M16 family metallopeptidase n=1 Tax=Massilia sp. erpn TaxID=2738142 RepID=UPI002105C956|nr:M16 family metallopeptidase [Massilia sp. erpn]UTY58787.1 insulinase family protein [Massilia sp. erpn]